MYTYSVRIMNAATGPGTVLETTANNGVGTPSDRKSFALTVTGNANSPFGLVKRHFLVCEPQERHGRPTGKYLVGASLDYYQTGGKSPTVKVTLLRAKDTGGMEKVKTVKGSVEEGFSPWFVKTDSALVTLSPEAIDTNDFSVRAQIEAGKYLKKKTKTSRVKLSRCG